MAYFKNLSFCFASVKEIRNTISFMSLWSTIYLTKKIVGYRFKNIITLNI